jgi:uracil-DNA glycosylase
VNTQAFMQTLSKLSFDNCFNPYSDRCPYYDFVDAPQRRFNLLSKVLARAESTGVDAMWIGRDLGYRGGRRTGLALTDDKHLALHASRWGIDAEPVTVGEEVAERTAAVMWSVLNRMTQVVFLWNVFPLHPHEPNEPMTNRQHNAAERRVGLELLEMLLLLLRPRHLVTFGNDATLAIQKLNIDIECERVRHPSYGGQSACLSSLKQLYQLV